MLSPSTDALRTGKALRASTVALTMNGMCVSLTPLRSWYCCLYLWRRCATRDMSTSETVVTCAEMRFDVTMCSDVFLRMGNMGTISTRSPGWWEGTNGVGAEAGAGVAVVAGLAAGDDGAGAAALGAADGAGPDGTAAGRVGTGVDGAGGVVLAGRAAEAPLLEDQVGAAAGAGAGAGADDGAAGAAGLGALGVDDPGRVSMWPRMSCFVTRPAIPVPGTLLMSTLCSAAILRTTGEDRVWRSSSGVMSARGFSAGG